MRTIYLLRHAHAIQAESGKDYDRSVEPREFGRIQKLSSHIVGHLGHVDYIYCSAATRTRETYDLLKPCLVANPEVQYVEELYFRRQDYPKFVWELLKSTPHDRSKVLIIGHNPGLTSLYNDISVPSYDPIHFPTLGFAVIQLDAHTSWENIDAHLALEKSILT